MGVQAMKHAALLQEWSTKIAECRSSGMTVKAWCAKQGIPIKTYYYWEKRFVTEATQQLSLPAPAQAGMLIGQGDGSLVPLFRFCRSAPELPNIIKPPALSPRSIFVRCFSK